MHNNLVQKNFLFGEEWLYYKIYTGNKTAESILLDVINPIAHSLISDNIIDRWFFIRYSDPKFHLRVRFHCTDKKNIGLIIERLLTPLKSLMDQDLLWKIQTDTYKREIDRYGENTMVLSEKLFYHDSVLILKAIEQFQVKDENLRWQFALKYIDNLLNLFRYSLNEKLELLEQLKNAFRTEFNVDSSANKQIDLKYRNNKSVIFKILSLVSNEGNEYEEIARILQEFNNESCDIIEEILEHKSKKMLMLNFNSLISSYVHMAMVRLFTSKNRLHELVIYDFMFKYYSALKYKNLDL